ncbi:MAG: hypothetical protein LBL99_02010 [Holosporaceae bacterium]|nr:hypothetical protein [Holosporaceae bacterium]
MIRLENALISRVCHDLITPFNAINLGVEAFDMSGDKSLLDGVKESVDKANVILKFMRELYSVKSNSYCYSLMSLKQLIADFLKRYGVSFDLTSDFENIPNVAGKIVMYNAIVAKEILPFGGAAAVKIDDRANEIVTTCIGKGVSVPSFDAADGELSHKNVMRFCLLQLLEEAGFKIIAYQEGSQVVLREQMIA